MPEPTSTAAVITLAAAGASIPVITIFGVPMGLRADVLMAGFAGSLLAIAMLNSVPSTGDTWREMMRVAFRRMLFTVCSSLAAGYVAPLALLVANIPLSLLLGGAFIVGAGAQQIVTFLIGKFSSPQPPAPPTKGAA